jgi:hypothetical protein
MVIIPVIANYQTRSRKSAMIAGQRPMFENIDSAKPEKHWLLWASLKAIGSGFACFLLAFFLSLLITIPWSKHYWAGEAQAVLGGFVLSSISELRRALLPPFTYSGGRYEAGDGSGVHRDHEIFHSFCIATAGIHLISTELAASH